MAPVPAVPVEIGVTAAGKVVAWLWVEKERSAELQDVVGRALRMSICRYDPCADGVDAVVKLLEDQMWEYAKTAAGDGEHPKPSIKQKLKQTLFHTAGSTKLNLPGWKEELEAWVETATGAVGWDSLPNRPNCLRVPSAAGLAERFPHMFYQEVCAAPAMNEHLLTALNEADELSEASARRDATAQWEAGVAGMLGIAIGLGVDELVNLSGAAPEIATGTAGGLIGVAVLRIVKTLKARPTSAQHDLHQDARIWAKKLLMEQTGRTGDPSVYSMFHEWVQCESARTIGSPTPAHAEQIAELAKLIDRGEACSERHFVRAATKLRSQLEDDQHSEHMRDALHGVIWTLWGPVTGR